MKYCVLCGGSMRPFLPPGTLLAVQPAALARLAVGQVVVFRQDGPAGRLVAHRVVSVKHIGGRLCVRTQGDNTCRPDEPLRPEQLVGRVHATGCGGTLKRVRRHRELAQLAAASLRRGLRNRRAVWRPARWIGVRVMGRWLKTQTDLVLRREGDEALLFNPGSGEVKLLNRTGADVWEMLDGRCDTDAIVERLTEQYEGAERVAVRADVERFLDGMRSTGLLARTSQPERNP